METVVPFQPSTIPHADDIIIVISPTGLDVMLFIVNTQAFSPLIGHNQNNQHGVGPSFHPGYSNGVIFCQKSIDGFLRPSRTLTGTVRGLE